MKGVRFMFKVIQTDRPAGDRIEEDNVFNNSGLDINFETYDCMDEAKLIELCADADAIVVAYAPITKKVIDNMPKCKIISFMATGFNSVDLEYATQKGIVVTHVPDYCSSDVADHTMGLLINIGRSIFQLDKKVREGIWEYEACGQPNRLSTQKIGIIGLGRIGSKVASRALSFGLEVLAYDPYVDEKYMTNLGVKKVGLDEVLKCDFVSLHCYLSEETKNIINEETLAQMKETAFLINTARGACVDIEALTRFLKERKIAGAALDVVNPEPLPTDHEIFSLDNVIFTPHSAFLSTASLKEVRRKSVEEVVRALKGVKPNSIVNKNVLNQENCRFLLGRV